MRHIYLKVATLLCGLLLHFWCDAQFSGNLVFDGSSQSVTTPSGMMNGLTVWTIEFFVKTTESRSNGTYWQRPTLLGNATAGDISRDFGITTDNGYIGMWAGLNSSTDNSFLSSTQINDNAWHHIAAVNDGTQVKLYVDGVWINSLATGLGFITNAAPLTIGASTLDFGYSGNVGNKNFFSSGIFDEVRFSNNVRYTAGFTVPAAAFTSDANTAALYHLDGCVSGTVPDASSNSNHALPYGFTGPCAPIFPPTPVIPSNPVSSNINAAEYFFDTDPGFGNGTPLPAFTPAPDISLTNQTINISTLANGFHQLYVRTRNAKSQWSFTNSSSFFIVPPSVILPTNPTVQDVVAAEYFFDTDPGFGNGTALPLTASADVTISNTVVTITGLSNGVHRLYTRTKNAKGYWSLVNSSTFNIVAASVRIPPNPITGSITKLEYFFDTDPGFGNGTQVTVAATTDLQNYTFAADISSLNDGQHTLYIRSFDDWGLTSTRTFSKGTILPVSWLSFTARKSGDAVVLDWQTAAEKQNARFEIERSSDGLNYKSIGTKPGNGAGSTVRQYAFTDVQPLNGINYYRIKQVDADGHFSYSTVIAIVFTDKNTISLFPNPASHFVTIVFPTGFNTNVVIHLLNENGQMMKQWKKGSTAILQADVSALPSGNYVLSVADGVKTFTQKLVIQH